MSYLSASQTKEVENRRAPYRHAMDRLKERHFPQIDDDEAEDFINMMTSLCMLRIKVGRDTNTAKLVNVETDTSVIIDLDLFEERDLIRVCYDPVANVLKTVFPKQ
jgi:hypothetical protein